MVDAPRLKRAVAQGKTLGRKPVTGDMGRVAVLRTQGASMRQIAEATGVGLGTIHRLLSVPETASKCQPQLLPFQ